MRPNFGHLGSLSSVTFRPTVIAMQHAAESTSSSSINFRVRNASNTNRLQEECDVLALRLIKIKDLHDLKQKEVNIKQVQSSSCGHC